MKERRFTAALLALALASSCLGPRGTAENAYAGGEGQEVEEIVGDPDLARDLAMESILTERRDGRLHVQFNLRNKRASRLPIEWRILWLDAAGFLIDSPGGWTPVVLGGKGFEPIARTAPTPEASGYRMMFRKPNNVR
jgi:uncharacterized protein YcfL